MKRIGILGGTFNPIHIGHLRLALEMREIFALDQLDLLPSARPPHRSHDTLLPFELRLQLVQAAVRDESKLRVNPVEGQRPGPSYTWTSLQEYACNAAAHHFFILGCGDFCRIAQWHRGRELPYLVDFIVVSRKKESRQAFCATVHELWPEARPQSNKTGCASSTAFCLPDGKCMYYLPTTRLDISASCIRSRFLQGRSLRYLVPQAVLDCLESERQSVLRCWSQLPDKPQPA